jgi:Rrf2 family protein
MKLSRTITYAIHAVLYLAESEEGVPVPCSQLAEAEGMPERFLLQVMRRMVNHGLVQSTRGVDGGYCLARRPADITLCDIVEAFDNPLELRLPVINGTSAELRKRVLQTLQAASQAARRELERLTLDELVQSNLSKKRPKKKPLAAHHLRGG